MLAHPLFIILGVLFIFLTFQTSSHDVVGYFGITESLTMISYYSVTLSYSFWGNIVKYKMRYCIISYVCVPRFRFCYEFLFFMHNPGHYTPDDPCSSPDGLLFTAKSSSENVPMSSVPSVYCGGWGVLHVRSALQKTRGGVDSHGLVCVDVHKTILAREIYCTNPYPKPES